MHQAPCLYSSRALAFLGLLLIVSSCARLDHVQIGDIDQRTGSLSAISVKVSENAVELADIADISRKIATNPETREHSKELRDFLAMINLGPRTGNPVYNEHYAENVLEQLIELCPSKRITGIRSIRESTTYGPISGEIVRVDAYCIH